MAKLQSKGQTKSSDNQASSKKNAKETHRSKLLIQKTNTDAAANQAVKSSQGGGKSSATKKSSGSNKGKADQPRGGKSADVSTKATKGLGKKESKQTFKAKASKSSLKSGTESLAVQDSSVEVITDTQSSQLEHKFSILTAAGKTASSQVIQTEAEKDEPASPGGSSEATDYYQKWLAYRKKFGHLEAKPYSVYEQFVERTPIQHPQWGWGFILKIENDRLFVLFSSGMRQLISNYRFKVD